MTLQPISANYCKLLKQQWGLTWMCHVLCAHRFTAHLSMQHPILTHLAIEKKTHHLLKTSLFLTLRSLYISWGYSSVAEHLAAKSLYLFHIHLILSCLGMVSFLLLFTANSTSGYLDPQPASPGKPVISIMFWISAPSLSPWIHNLFGHN